MWPRTPAFRSPSEPGSSPSLPEGRDGSVRPALSTARSWGSVCDTGGEAGRTRGAPRPRLQCACAPWAWPRRPGAHAGLGEGGPWRSGSCSSLRSLHWGDQMRTGISKAFRTPWEIETYRATRCAPGTGFRAGSRSPWGREAASCAPGTRAQAALGSRVFPATLGGD